MHVENLWLLRRWRRWIITVPALMLASCTALAPSTDYDRHVMSTLRVDGEHYLFEASTGARYPANDREAESTRLEWLAQWMQLRDYCRDGHRVVKRVVLSASEASFSNHDLRYFVVCTPG